MSARVNNPSGIIHHSGFIQHGLLTFASDPTSFLDENYTRGKLKDAVYKKNLIEKAGDLLMWHVVSLPRHIWNALQEPKVLTVAFTALAMIAIQFAFYPIASILAVKQIVALLSPYITMAGIKLAAYIVTQAAVLGWGTRAFGRFSNKDLMSMFYGEKALREPVDQSQGPRASSIASV